MVSTIKYGIGALLLVILSASIYVTFQDNLRIDVTKSSTTFKVRENNSWSLTGTEYNALYNGSKKLTYRSVNVTEYHNRIEAWIYREAKTYQGAIIKDTYYFRGDVEGVEMFPVTHTVEIINGQGLVYQYDVRNLISNSSTYDVVSPVSFGKNMNVEFDSGYYLAKVYSTNKLVVKYRLAEDYKVFNVRLFDPQDNTYKCKTTYWNDSEYGICEEQFYEYICSGQDNATCYNQLRKMNKTCVKSVEQKSKEECVIESIKVGSKRLYLAENGIECCFTDGKTGNCVYGGRGACINRKLDHNTLFSGEEGFEFEVDGNDVNIIKDVPMAEKSKYASGVEWA